MGMGGRKGQSYAWNDSTVIVEKVREKRVNVEKVRCTSRHLTRTVCLLIGIAICGLSHPENRDPQPLFPFESRFFRFISEWICQVTNTATHKTWLHCVWASYGR